MTSNMALNRKYAALPDLDNAPDIYETPDLTDDNSTVPTTAGQARSDLDFEEDDEEEDNDDEYGDAISHTRIRVDQARSKFMPSQVDARGVDFSDRLNGKRKSYRASSRRQRVLDDGTKQYGDLTDDEDAEDLEHKIARLKREIEEAKEEYGKQTANTKTDDELVSLSQALDAISTTPKGLHPPAAQTTNTAHEKSDDTALDSSIERVAPISHATYTLTYAPNYEQSHALAKAADFDQRLDLLERTIGVASSAVPELEHNGLPRAIMPTIDTLQKQILTLSEASTVSLDSIGRRVRNLITETEQLEKTRKAAKVAQDALGGSAAAESDEQEQTAKINALYGTLPTIEQLTPLLPPLLDRLRSLRTIHADAATAAETLDSIEASQSEMAAEIKQWREGLDKMETAMEEGEEAMDNNMKVIEGWVKGLEAKVADLS